MELTPTSYTTILHLIAAYFKLIVLLVHTSKFIILNTPKLDTIALQSPNAFGKKMAAYRMTIQDKPLTQAAKRIKNAILS